MDNALSSILTGSVEQRLELVAKHGDALADAVAQGSISDKNLVDLRSALVDVIQQDVGSGKARLPVGILLGRIGDPRLSSLALPEPTSC